MSNYTIVVILTVIAFFALVLLFFFLAKNIPRWREHCHSMYRRYRRQEDLPLAENV